MAAYVDGEVDQVEVFYNGYISPISQVVRRETLLPLQQATLLEEEDEEQKLRTSSRRSRALVEYEPDPEEILTRLVPDYVEISIYPSAARVDRLRARRADDRDAQRVGERGRADRGSDLADEPCPPGRDHPGDHGSGCRRRRARWVEHH